MVPRFTKPELEAFKKHWNQFDSNGDGAINASELKRAISSFDDARRRFGGEPSDQVVATLIRQADGNGDGRVTFEEFSRMVMMN
nr:PREDICTED: calmodulin-like protein 5 [Anolis carolinensis]|eukprot:XP_016853688.1 PREDICTED: calmodulin-like protein 5 [Anolis carolinensis]